MADPGFPGRKKRLLRCFLGLLAGPESLYPLISLGHIRDGRIQVAQSLASARVIAGQPFRQPIACPDHRERVCLQLFLEDSHKTAKPKSMNDRLQPPTDCAWITVLETLSEEAFERSALLQALPGQ